MAIVIAVSVIVRFAVASNNASQARKDNQALSEANQEIQNQIRSGNLTDPAVAQAEQNDSTGPALSACVSAAGTDSAKLAACAAQATP